MTREEAAKKLGIKYGCLIVRIYRLRKAGFVFEKDLEPSDLEKIQNFAAYLSAVKPKTDGKILVADLVAMFNIPRGSIYTRIWYLRKHGIDVGKVIPGTKELEFNEEEVLLVAPRKYREGR